MIYEVAQLFVDPARTAAFEAAYAQASPLIGRATGNLGHELRRCVEQPGKYLLLVKWARIEDHLEGFRNSPDLAEWRRLLGPFYVQPSQIEHYAAL